MVGARADMTLDGHRANNPYQGVWNRQNPIYFQWSANITIERVKVYNGTTIDIHLDTCDNVLLRNLSLYSAEWDGIHLGNLDNHGFYSNHNVTIEDVYMEGFMGYSSAQHYAGWTGGSGLDIGKSTDVEIRRVKVINAGAKGIYLDQVTNAIIDDSDVENTNIHEQTGAYSIMKSVNVRLTNSTSKYSHGLGVDAALLYNSEIAGNIILEPELDGIALWQSRLTLVSDNILRGINATSFGIKFTESADIETRSNVVNGFRHNLGLKDDLYVIISENLFLGAARSPIYLFLNCTDTQIHYNDIVKSGLFPSAIYNEDANSTIHAENNWWGTADNNQLMHIVPANQSIIWNPFSLSPYTSKYE